MQDNETVTHGLHWLTLSEDGWRCAHPDCDWHLGPVTTLTAQHAFDHHHVKLSEVEATVPT